MYRLPKVLFFDINETVLNTAPLKKLLNECFQEDVFDLWFSKLLHYSLVSTMTGTFKEFGLIASDALKAVSIVRKVELQERFFYEIIKTLGALPAHSDVVESLNILRHKGYMLAALSNSSEVLLEKQLASAGIANLFDKKISVESYCRYKPDTQVYSKAANGLNVEKGDCMLIAAHDWDILGALCSGLMAAFIKRSEGNCYFLSPKPQLEVIDLLALSEKL